MDISLFVPTQPAFRENVRQWAGPGAQRSRHDFLGMAHSVHGRSVAPVYTKLERAMSRGHRLRVILLGPSKFPTRAANCAGVKGDRGDEQVGVTQLFRFLSSDINVC